MASLEQTIGLFGQIMTTLPMARHEALERACRMVEAEARDAIGTYRYNWPQLAESTQRDRVNQGFPANEPLLRTGEMRDSIEHQVFADRGIGYVGSNNMKAVWHELGTSRVPPRPFLMNAAIAMERPIHELTGLIYHAHIIAGLGLGLPFGYARYNPTLIKGVESGPGAVTGLYAPHGRGVWTGSRADRLPRIWR